MNTKGFVLLLVGVLALGGILGGAFAGGIALGKSRGAEAAQTGLPVQSASAPRPDPSGQTDPQSLQQLQQRIQAGDITDEELAELRQQFQGRFGQGNSGAGFARQGFAGGGGLTGTIEVIEGNTVTVNTPEGPLQATVGEETTIQRTIEVELQDLVVGMRLTVNGERGEDGNVVATGIFVLPEGLEGFGGSDLIGGAGPRGRQP